MEFRPLMSALSRHKAIVAVLVVEFAVTLAILSNALSLATARVRILQTPSGIREAGFIVASPSAVGALSSTLDRATYEALGNLVRTQPGVQSVSLIGQAPLTGVDRWSGAVSTEPGKTAAMIGVAVYTGDRSMPKALGLTLQSGRWFTAGEILPASEYPDISQVHLLLLTDSLARKLFKRQDSVGRNVYFDGALSTVVGVVASLSRPAITAAIRTRIR